MTATSKIRNIPLSLLALSPANVRKTAVSAAEDAALEASIRAHGILQNLIVHPTTSDGKGVYEVDAGGRRFRILQKLAAEGVIDPDAKIPCKVEEAEDAIKCSLAENTVRAAMHPADEFVAMAALIDDGATWLIMEPPNRQFCVSPVEGIISEKWVRQVSNPLIISLRG